MIIETYKVKMKKTMYKYELSELGKMNFQTVVPSYPETFDHYEWEMECAHVLHIFELLLEQLDMDENDSLCMFDETEPSFTKKWKIYSWHKPYYVVARLIQDDEVADCPTSD
jgi:hypothetical protein